MSDVSQHVQEVRRILFSLYPYVNVPELSDEEPLAEHVGLDSLGLIQLTIELEAEFNIRLDGDDLAPRHYDTIASIAKLIHDKVE